MHQSGTEANKESEACLPQGVSDISEKKQQTQIQTTKLSGLRMPSPSLGFFSLVCWLWLVLISYLGACISKIMLIFMLVTAFAGKNSQFT